jgi:hypothetical protein
MLAYDIIKDSVTPDMDCGKLIIVDWDDTLLPTSMLGAKGYHPGRQFNLDNDTRENLKKLEESAIGWLELARSCGKVCIVTNSEEGWVDISGKLFVPNLHQYIRGNKLDIVSARTRYQKMFPDKPATWKVAAMHDCVRKWFRSPDVITDFISFGDSPIDRLAAITVGNNLSISTTKNVKFCQLPTTEQLHRQQQLVYQTFPHLCTAKNDLDMMLTITMNPVKPLPEGVRT